MSALGSVYSPKADCLRVMSTRPEIKSSPVWRRFLTIVPKSATLHDESRSSRTHSSDAIRSVERDRCLPRGLATAPEQLRASCAAVLRPQREVLSLDWDRRGRVTPARQIRRAAASQEDWPGAEQKGRKPPGKSRGGTPTGERPPPYPPPHAGEDKEGARRIRRCGSLTHASVGVPPPFIL
jgi:hypothetical protein